MSIYNRILVLRAARRLMQTDSDFVEDGCGDVSLVLKLFCDPRHIPCEIKGGRVVAQGEAFDHV